MKTLISKITRIGLLKLEIVFGVMIMAAAIIILPYSIISEDPTLMLNPYVLLTIIGGILFFALAAYLCFIRPYVLYCKTKDVQVETDGEFLYIHAKKEAKIPLSEISNVSASVGLPFLLQKGFLGEIIIYLLSEKYGDIYLDIPGYGEYRLRFVPNVHDSADELIHFLND